MAMQNARVSSSNITTFYPQLAPGPSRFDRMIGIPKINLEKKIEPQMNADKL